MLDQKLARHIKAYANDLKKAGKFVESPPAVRGTLHGLIDHIAAATGPEPSSFPELPALDTFRKIWNTIHSEGQLRQALDHLPTNAGPLNSSALVHRSIVLMRELSPGYLQQFLSYVEALSWMEQINDNVTLAPKAAAKKRTRTTR